MRGAGMSIADTSTLIKYTDLKPQEFNNFLIRDTFPEAAVRMALWIAQKTGLNIYTTVIIHQSRHFSVAFLLRTANYP